MLLYLFLFFLYKLSFAYGLLLSPLDPETVPPGQISLLPPLLFLSPSPLSSNSLVFVSNSLSFVPLEQITLLCDENLVPECPVPTSWPLPHSHLSRALEGFAEKKKIMKDDY